MLCIAVCLVASNMRMSITALGPILEDIAADQGVSAAVLGALASLPLVVWALVSPLTHLVSSRLGTTNTVTWSLVLLIAGTVWRSLPGTILNLWIGTVIIGVAIAIMNVLMPAVIKRDFGLRIPIVMGLYTAALGGMGSIGPGIVVPVSQIQGASGTLGWRIGLLATGALVPIALIVWVLATRRARASTPGATATQTPELPTAEVLVAEAPAAGLPATEMPPAGEPVPEVPALPVPNDRTGRRIWRDPLAWCLAIYMGTQSAVFYTLVTWLAPIEISLGTPQALAGVNLMYFQAIGVAGSALVAPLLHGRLQRHLPVLVPLLSVVSALGILLTPQLILLWISVAGFACGAALSVALTLIAMRARDHHTATVLSGMAQAIGYLVAAVGPFLFGWLFEASSSWTLPLISLAAIALVQTTMGVIVGQERYVLEPRPGRTRVG